MIQDITDALTADEARLTTGRFLEALATFDEAQDLPRLVADLQAAANLADDLARGIAQIQKDTRGRLTPEALRDIVSTTDSSYALAKKHGVSASTIRMARQRLKAA